MHSEPNLYLNLLYLQKTMYYILLVFNKTYTCIIKYGANAVKHSRSEIILWGKTVCVLL